MADYFVTPAAAPEAASNAVPAPAPAAATGDADMDEIAVGITQSTLLQHNANHD